MADYADYTVEANPVVVEVSRGSGLESCHRGAFAVCSSAGNVMVSMGNIRRPVYARSAIKFFQTIPLVESGAAEAFGFGDRELALTCASHHGAPEHVDVVRSMLKKSEIKESDLACGVHWPYDRAAANALVREGKKPSPLHNNCSGKHAGMLAFMRYSGQGLAGYTMPERAIQRRISVVLEEFVGEPFDTHNCALDGCSVPTWSASLKGWARACAKFVSGRSLSPERYMTCRRIMQACFNEPELVGGKGSTTTRLLKIFKDEALVKLGAQGVYFAGLPELDLGIAVKIDDGDGQAAYLLMVNLLAFLLPEKVGKLAGELKQTRTNRSGQEIGERRLAMAVQDTMQMMKLG